MKQVLELILLIGAIWITGYQVYLHSELSRQEHVVAPLPTEHSGRTPPFQNVSLAKKTINGVTARAYESWPKSVPLPCYPPKDRKHYHKAASPPDNHRGFLFMKLMKTGGSSAAGINIRIMKHVAEKQKKDFDFCSGRFEHSWGHEMLKNRGRPERESFTWTVVREPTQRAVSQFFHFEVSRENKTATDHSFQHYLRDAQKIFGHYYLQVLPSFPVSQNQAARRSAKLINNILSDYDFIGVTERLDETAVALMMLLDLPMGTALYLNSKQSGGYDDGASGTSCTFIQPSVISDGMKAYFRAPYWQSLVRWDEKLYQAASRSLGKIDLKFWCLFIARNNSHGTGPTLFVSHTDLTIDRLGRTKFETNLNTFRHALQVAQERCLPREVFPCTSDGKKQRNRHCYWKDSGCGHECLDEVATELGIW